MIQRDGKEEVLKLEGSSISGLRRRGITKDLLTIGNTVRIAGYASSRRPTFMLVNNVLLEDNVEMILSGGRQQWSGSTLAGSEDANKDIKAATAKAEAEGIFRVWTWGRMERGWWFFGEPDKFVANVFAIKGGLGTRPKNFRKQVALYFAEEQIGVGDG